MAITAPISYWKLDEASGNASDSIGSNTLTNTSTTFAAGLINNGAIFNASSSKLVMGSTAFSSSYSYSFWLYRNSGGSYYGLISKDDGSTRLLSILSNNSGNIEGTVWLSTGSQSITPFAISNSVWNHITITVDSGVAIKVYLNGNLIQTIAISFGALTTSFGTWFGADQFSGGRWFLDGKMDEIGLWNVAITADEVSKIYNAGRGNQYPFTDNLLTSGINYYKLDESSGNAVDSIGGNTATNNGTATYSTGKINNGVNVNGSSQYLSFSNCPRIGNGAFTISAWIKGTSFGADGAIAGFGTGNTNQGTTFDVRSQKLFVDFYAGTNLAGVTTLSTGVWYFATVTYDGSVFRLYLNGTLESTSAGTSASIVAGSGTIGRAFWVGGNYFNGQIDEVGFWQRALTSGEITTLYNSGNGVQYPFGTAYAIVAAVGSFILTGISNNFIKALRMLATVRTYTLTGIAAIFRNGKGIVAEVGSFILTGYDATFRNSGWTAASKNAVATMTSAARSISNWINKTKS